MVTNNDMPKWALIHMDSARRIMALSPNTMAEGLNATIALLADELDTRDKRIEDLLKMVLEGPLEAARKDSKRLDKAQELYFGADFAYERGGGEDAKQISVALLRIPGRVGVGVDFRAFLDAAIQAGLEGK